MTSVPSAKPLLPTTSENSPHLKPTIPSSSDPRPMIDASSNPTIPADSNPTISFLSKPPPFKEFQQVLAFISSIGLATSASCAFSLVGAKSAFNETTDLALRKIKRSGVLLSWASACFIVALCFIAATQLLYTEAVIINLLLQKDKSRASLVVRIGLGCFAWIALGFQTTALVLIGQALHVFAPGPVMLANYGMAGCVFVVGVALIGMASQQKGLKKLGKLLTCGGLFS